MSETGIVIVGAGQAGFQAAASLREAGHAGPVTMIGDEPSLPYQRPPLSKAYLAGKVDATGLFLRAPGFFADHRIACETSVQAASIDRAAQHVRLSDGRDLAYDHLILATGSRNRPLPVPGTDLAGVHQLRSIADADRIQAALAEARNVAIIGAGFIGLEFASICAARGLTVTVVEAADRPMARAVSEPIAAFFRETHESAGIRFLFGNGVQAIEGRDGRAEALQLSDGTACPADLVLIGIGVIPNQDIAAEAGLRVEDGIVVDSVLATDDPCVSAVGDCARFPTRFAAHGTARVESVQNAIDQGRCVAARIAGRATPYDAVPWFWSDQGGHKLQMVGLPIPSDVSVRRRTANGFAVFRYRGTSVTGIETVDSAAEHMAARRIIARGLSPTPEEVADPAFDLKALAMGRGGP
ncbi:NAD(P)/FAD-dependent oxidoreductase [Methylobacterium marchantiae]|uniref:NAD(P)/FAD-dependent oxidoreductase n=1 Tax=Methylobacterium marchantiae TaxID=600331 RepID=A0ABW3WUJ3_9HYPH|nr:Rhodocoxin reductase [Methylobacterium marchantiae]